MMVQAGKLKYLPFAIVLVMLLFAVLTASISVFNKATFSNAFSIHLQIGVIGIFMVLTSMFFNKNYWKYIFSVLLLLYVTPLINLPNINFYIGIGLFKIELISLSLLIFHLNQNKEVINTFTNFFKASEEEKAEDFEIKIRSFQKRFSNKNKIDLKYIIEDDGMVPEAVEAAKRLLNKR